MENTTRSPSKETDKRSRKISKRPKSTKFEENSARSQKVKRSCDGGENS